MRRQIRAGAVVATVCAALAIGVSTPAFAAGPAPASATTQSDASAIAAAIDGASPVSEPVAVSADSNSAMVTQTAGVVVDVPTDPQAGVSTSSGGLTVGLGLPVNGATKDAAVADGTAVYQNNDHTDIAVQPLSGGAMRALVVLNSAAAPHDYSFALDLPANVRLELQDDGSVALLQPTVVTDPATGEQSSVEVSVGHLDAAWAKDANGTDIATRYTIAGNTVTQHIDFGGDTAFPIVADPHFEWHWNKVYVKLNPNETRYVGHGGAWALGGAIGAGIGVFAGGGAGAIVGGAAVGGLLASIGADRVDSHLRGHQCIQIKAQWIGWPWDLGVSYSWYGC